MSRALRIYQPGFDKDFFARSSEMRARIGAKLDEMGLNLRAFQHYQMTGSNRFRLRVGD